MYWAYLLRCADGSYYAGHTDDLDARFYQHQSGALGGYTATRRPVELVWSQDFSERDEAQFAEARIKGWNRAKKQALIAGDWELVRKLARRGSASFETPQTASSAPQDKRILHNTAYPEEGSKPQAESPSRRTRRTATDTPPPIIVLVRPQLGENIGKAARAMLNFGLTEMRLVAPRDGWPNPSAGPAASGADIVLEQARVFETTADAVADCAHVYATTVRKRGVTKPVRTPEQAAREVPAQPGRSAFLFGPERSGLNADDVALARTIVTAPINPEFGSLNLAQAVMLVAYELSRHRELVPNLVMPTLEELLPPAPQVELEGLIAHLDAMLEPLGYYFPEDRRDATRRNLRGLLTKPGWNHLEVRTLRGVLTTLQKLARRDS